MISISKFVFIILLSQNLVKAQIDWQQGDWAFKCDFYGNDLKNVKTRGEDCGSRCASTSGCTHFTWTTYNGGTCWMKKGRISKSNAKYTGNKSTVCGIVNQSSGGDGGNVATSTNKPSGDPNKFPGCQFKFGRDYKGDNIDYNGFDYITFWIGAIADGCSGKPQCTDFNPYWEGSMLNKVKALNKPAVFYGYIIAFEARNKDGLRDCNDGYPNLCQRGANFIRNNGQLIVDRYEMHSKKIAEYLGTSHSTVFLIEPDFYQYYGDKRQEGGTVSGNQMRALFDNIVSAIKKHLPNALISWDISPWISESEMTEWWNNFKTAKIDFINTSGGENHAESQTIQLGHGLTWSFMHRLTGKNIIADSGYGVVGNQNNNNGPWYDSNNLNNRVSDGVIADSLGYASQKPNYRPNLC